jgi:hypothetical protein
LKLQFWAIALRAKTKGIWGPKKSLQKKKKLFFSSFVSLILQLHDEEAK